MYSRQLAPPSPLLALIEAAHGDWQKMFVWLGIALFVDTVDGPLARRVRVTEGLPRWSGEWLDLIVDYATYIGVPAFVLAESKQPSPSCCRACSTWPISAAIRGRAISSASRHLERCAALSVRLHAAARSLAPDCRLLRAADLRPHCIRFAWRSCVS
jgi:phosphatidylglycerophosphate synthase